MKPINVTTELTTNGTAFQFDEAKAKKLADKQTKDSKASIVKCTLEICDTKIQVFKDEDYTFYIYDAYGKDGYKIRDKDWIVNLAFSTGIYSPEEFEKKFKVVK